MNRKGMLALAILLLTTILGCSLPTTLPFSSHQRGNITFIIPIQVEAFSKDEPLHVSLWNEEQITINEKNALCGVSYDAQTGIEKIQCPEGIEYREVLPEEFTISLRDIRTSITITSMSIRMGEKYMIQISGLSNDNCNSTSASFTGKANSKTITLDELTWMTTLMACP